MLFFIYSIVYGSSFFITIWLLVFLYKSRSKTKDDKVVLQTYLAAAFWFLADFFTLNNFFSPQIDLFSWRLSFFASFLVTSLLLRTILVLSKIKISKIIVYFSYLLFLIISYFILLTDYIISGLEKLKFAGDSNFIAGPFLQYWGILISLMLLLSFIVALKNFKYIKETREKTAFKIFSLGLIIIFVLASITNIILPILSIDFPRLAVLGILFILLSISYIIYKYEVFGFKIKSFNIKIKITIVMVLVAMIPIISISAYFYYNTAKVLQAGYLDEQLNDLNVKKESIDYFLNLAKEDILFLSQLSNLHNFINFDDENSFLYKKNLTNNMLNFSRQRKIYYQVRYIDENGQEIIRVDNNGSEVFVVEEENLQNKSERYYFQDAMNVGQGVIFVSPLDLNIENGEIEVPYKPVIRYGTPIFDNLNNPKGIIITNIDAQQLLDIVDEENNKSIENYLINKDGYFLSHPDSSMEWGFMFNRKENNLSQVYPNIYENIKNSKKQLDQFYCYVEDCYISYEFIYPSGETHGGGMGSNDVYTKSLTKAQGKDHYWVLFSKVDKKELENITNSGLVYVYLIVFVIIVITILLSFILSRFISKPLYQLKESIAIVNKGDLNNKIFVNTKDELKDLADDFNKMIKAIKQSRRDVDKKVKRQTKQIIDKNKELENQQLAVLNILEDVESEKKKTEALAKDLEKFKLAVDNAYSHIVITDENGICLYANNSVERITGFSRKEILGKKVGTKENWGGNMPHEVYRKLWRTVKIEKRAYNGNVTNTRKNGEKYEALSSISPVLDKHGHVKFFVAIERDVTEEKKIDRAKSEFVSLASHQLRTPLSTINWYAEMLLSEDAGKLNKEQKEFTGEIYKGNQRMVDLVNSLLNVSRIELGTLAVDPVPTDLIAQTESVLNEIKPLIAKKKLKVVKKFNKKIPKINLDDKLMRIVWQNLLSNSLKYTPNNGKISILIDKDKKNINIEVADTGMGIPKNQQDKIFTKLFRADNVREKETDGTGLGLYIVKSVIDQFGGKVWFKSTEGRGTTFFINIPIKGSKAKTGTKGLEYTK